MHLGNVDLNDSCYFYSLTSVDGGRLGDEIFLISWCYPCGCVILCYCVSVSVSFLIFVLVRFFITC